MSAEREVQGSEAELGRLREENGELWRKLDRVEAQLAEAQEKLHELEERNSALERELGERAVQIARERQEAKAEIMRLRKELSGGSPLQRSGPEQPETFPGQ